MSASNGNATTAEVCESCLPTLVALQNRNIGLEETVRRQASALGAARRAADPETKAREHARWREVAELFDYWRRQCRHPKSRFSAKRFAQALPYVESHGIEMCRRAIDGAAYDPGTSKRKNGSIKRWDDWELIFREGDRQFEEFCNKAPRNRPSSTATERQRSDGSATAA